MVGGFGSKPWLPSLRMLVLGRSLPVLEMLPPASSELAGGGGGAGGELLTPPLSDPPSEPRMTPARWISQGDLPGLTSVLSKLHSICNLNSLFLFCVTHKFTGPEDWDRDIFGG